ncbi:MAG: extracellular solute-binding protein [Acetatifactor sp.]
MKHKKWFKKVISSIVVLLMAVVLLPWAEFRAWAKTDYSMDDYDEVVSTYSIDQSILGYNDYLKQFQESYPETTLHIGVDQVVRYDENDKATDPAFYSDYEGMPGKSVYTTENSLIEFEFQIEEEGFYDMSFVYYPVAGKNSDIERSIFIDGKLPYREMAAIDFYRIWKFDVMYSGIDQSGSAAYNWEKDNQGNDIRPTMMEVPEWITGYVYDSEGYVTAPLAVYLTKGTHTITVLSLREPMMIHEIVLGNAKVAESYEDRKKDWDASGATATSGHCIVIEGENATRTSSQMLYPIQDQSSPSVSPSSAKELLNNTIGGNSWRYVGQWIEWDFDIAESGYYNISLYDCQNFVRGIYVSRRITIDGEVPFRELEDYGFSYAQSWREDTLSDEKGVPYEFYLEAGHHRIRMEAVLGDFSKIISEVQLCVQQLNSIYREVIKITGVSPDTYRDYQLESSLPNLHEELVAVRDRLSGAINEMEVLAGRNSDKLTVLLTMRDQLDELIEDGEYFVRVIGSYKINVRACGNWVSQVTEQPLAIDRIMITSPDAEMKIQNTSLLSKIGYECKRLFYSFIIDYNQIGNVIDNDRAEDTTITLWIGSGRDQANIIKKMIDEGFTNRFGVNVNVQLVDMNTLLRAELAGEGPDVAIQVANTNGIAGAVLNTGNDTPVNYGIRNAVLDLKQFADLDEVKKRFAPAAMVPFEFDGATYALPETTTFPVMFYRKDILAEIGLSVPETWDDVKVAMAVLSQNQMEFGMLPSEQIFAMLLYQNGGAYYSEGGDRSALDSDVAVNTFKEYCEFYTDYKLDKETSVEERFRTGECPIIIADYTTYNNLVVSAPDIAGLWDFAPVPGTVQSDGSVDHSTGCTGLASIIMADTEHPDACWEFLKWWTSAEVQTQYGREMESLMGSAARVPTANLEAFSNMPWPIDDFEALEKAFEWVKGIPQVPGGYYSWRNVNNAFYTVTTETDTASPREELMDKVIYINAEIDYKREELGLPLAGN